MKNMMMKKNMNTLMLSLVDFQVIVHGKQGPGGGVVLRRVNVILLPTKVTIVFSAGLSSALKSAVMTTNV